jgi:hypothetical protein
MPKVGEVEASVADVLQAGKAILEGGSNPVRTRAYLRWTRLSRC